jgi:tellurite resistance protein TerC
MGLHTGSPWLSSSEGGGSSLLEFESAGWGLRIGFTLIFVAAVVVDMYINRKHRELSLRESAIQTACFISVGMAFGAYLMFFTHYGTTGGSLYFSAFLTELTLSVDNLFVIALILKAYKVPREYHHTVLLWGIIGAFVFRLTFIAVGAEAIERYAFITIVFGAWLMYKAYDTFVGHDENADFTKKATYRFLSRVLPSTPYFHGPKFLVKVPVDRQRKEIRNDSVAVSAFKWVVTPLLMCVGAVEFTDILFATDSVPAVLSITSDPFIAFTSNAFAVLGLRCLYFLYAHLEDYISWLNEGVALILGFVGFKLVVANALFMGWVMDLFGERYGVHVGLTSFEAVRFDEAGIHFSPMFGLAFIAVCLVGSLLMSIFAPKDTDEADVSEVIINDHEVMAELYLGMGTTMHGEWTRGLMATYIPQAVDALRRYDSDGAVPAFGFADRMEEIGTFNSGESVLDGDLRMLDLGGRSNLAAVLSDIEKRAKQTTGRIIAAIMFDGRLPDDEAQNKALEVFVTMPSNVFVLFIRVSDEPGGSEFLLHLDDFNVGERDRCDTIFATDDAGKPKEVIANKIGDEIEQWLQGKRDEVAPV